jgi:hypothetical protein
MLDSDPQDTATDYSDIFALRGQLYHHAMQAFPDARAQEFQAVIAEADIAADATVVDFPAGGAYISRYLDGVNLIGLEVTQTFVDLAQQQQQNVILCTNEHFPLPTASADRIISIAGLHHIHDKGSIFAEMRRLLKPAGRLVVADIAEDSYVRNFLDVFVDRYSDTGHSGWYFGPSTRAELQGAGFDVVGDKRLSYYWCAADIDQLAEFCRLLFGMVRADTATVAQGIREYLGTQQRGNQVGLNWQLHCFTCAVPHSARAAK